MTNEMIILNARFGLMEEGILKETGNKMRIETKEGGIIEVDEPEEIHTYQGWKSLNRQVKKGEKSVATIQIWNHARKNPKNDKEEKKERIFLINAFFFTEEQTEVMT